MILTPDGLEVAAVPADDICVTPGTTPRVRAMIFGNDRYDKAKQLSAVWKALGVWIERIYTPCDTHGRRHRYILVIGRLRKRHIMDVLKMSDAKLAETFDAVATEIRRRAAAKTCDDLTIIKGNEMGKRALAVAIAGKHSIAFVGPPNCGKSMLRAAIPADGPVSFEAWPCPCGHHGDPRVACNCTAGQIERQRRKLPEADITIEIVPPSQRDLAGPAGTGWKDIERYVAGMTQHASIDLDEDCRNILKAACNELAIDAKRRERIIAVARTIANMDQSPTIRIQHLTEAVNYRPFWRL